MNTISEYEFYHGFGRNTDKDARLEQLFATFRLLCDEYARTTEEWDIPPYAFNENATSSLLAAAAWKTDGMVAIAEYKTEKKNKNDMRFRPVYGRGDIYIYDSKTDTEFSLESKQYFPFGMDENNTIYDKINICKKDAKCNTVGSDGYRFGLMLVTPAAPTKHKNVNDYIDKWLNIIIETKPAFHGRYTLKSPDRGQDRCYPGFVFALYAV